MDIKYDSIGGAMTIAGVSYQLAAGNMFIIRLNSNWAQHKSTSIGVSVSCNGL
jgi:hypothetical protein